MTTSIVATIERSLVGETAVVDNDRWRRVRPKYRAER